MVLRVVETDGNTGAQKSGNEIGLLADHVFAGQKKDAVYFF
jgi:hypothetical protein